MSAVENILNMIAGLSAEDRTALKIALSKTARHDAKQLEGFVTEERFAKGRVCPHCGCMHVVRNGKRADGTQRYVCRDCGKSFTITTNTIAAGTRKELSVWKNYISCMMQGMSIRKTAEVCGIHRNTAFYWRHKILDAFQSMAEAVELDGIVEMDETFFPISYKGNHSNSADFVMPRDPHKRGKEVRKRGLSKEQVCVPCAVNRNGMSIAKASNLGRISSKDIHGVFDGRIDDDATLVTDKMNAYVKFANDSELDLVQLKGGKAKKGIYNIQHINSYHSKLKRFMFRFCGVSTKYLNNYLVWNNFVNYAKETDAEKQNILLRFVLTAQRRVTCREISKRSALPFAV